MLAAVSWSSGTFTDTVFSFQGMQLTGCVCVYVRVNIYLDICKLLQLWFKLFGKV